MTDSNLTIKRVYDQYNLKDYNYGDKDSVNLNPRREIHFDKLDTVMARLQEVTDDIIRKRITPPLDEEGLFRGPVGSEGLPHGIPFEKQRLLAQIGGGGQLAGSGFGLGNGLLFPSLAPDMSDTDSLENLLEGIIGTFPVEELLDEFDAPPQLDCQNILRRFGYDDQEISAMDAEMRRRQQDRGGGGAEDEGDGSVSNGGDDGGSAGDGNLIDPDGSVAIGEGDEGVNDVKECALVELTWLKIILVLVKVLRMLRNIIDMVLSIIVPLLEILRLAVGAWLNPPNIPAIAKVIVKMVTAIIVMVTSLVIQLIWNLLNMDCVADQTASIMAQIRRALSTFSSVMNAFSPDAVNMFANRIEGEVINPINTIIGEAMANREAWSDVREQMREQWDTLTSRDFWGDMREGMARDIASGVLNTPQARNAADVKKQANALLVGPYSPFQGALRSMQEAQQGFREAQSIMRGTGVAMMAHPTIVIDDATVREGRGH